MHELRSNEIEFWNLLDLQISYVQKFVQTCFTVNPCKESPGFGTSAKVAYLLSALTAPLGTSLENCLIFKDSFTGPNELNN